MGIGSETVGGMDGAVGGSRSVDREEVHVVST